jgi:O-antigen/teichoic acid export membrane protein
MSLILKNSIWNSGGFLAASLVSFFALPVIVNGLGVEVFGIYGIISALVMPLSLTNLGMEDAAVKFVSENLARGNEQKAVSYAQTALFFSLIVGLAGGILFALLGPPLVEVFFDFQQVAKNDLWLSFALAGLGWFFSQIYSVLSSISRAFQRYEFVAIGLVLLMISSSLLGVASILMGGRLVAYMLATVIASFIVLLFYGIVAYRLGGIAYLLPCFHKECWKSCFHFGLWKTLAGVGGIVANQSEKYLLGSILGASSVGLFNIAFRLEQVTYVVVYKMAEVLLPSFSANSKDPLEQQASTLMRASWMLTCLSVLVMVPLIPLSSTALRLWMGEEVSALATPILQSITFAGMLGSAKNASIFYLMGVGKTKWLAVLSLVTGIVTILAGALVLPLYGLSAAGWAAIASMCAQVVAVNVMLKLIFGKLAGIGKVVVFLYSPIIVSFIYLKIIFLIQIPDCSNWFVFLLFYGILSLGLLVFLALSHLCLPGAKERFSNIQSLIRSYFIS